jgi:AcrR family transcriptional regulator
MPAASSPATSKTRERLLDAAARMIVREGYQGARIADVAREAGLTTGAIYFHFRNKEELFLAAFDRIQESTQRVLIPPGGKRDLAAMVRTFGPIIEQLRSSPELRILNFELGLLGSRDPGVGAELKAGLAETIDLLAGALPPDRELKARGVPFTGRELATVLIALGNGLALMAMLDPDRPTRGLVERSIRQLAAGRDQQPA